MSLITQEKAPRPTPLQLQVAVETDKVSLSHYSPDLLSRCFTSFNALLCPKTEHNTQGIASPVLSAWGNHFPSPSCHTVPDKRPGCYWFLWPPEHAAGSYSVGCQSTTPGISLLSSFSGILPQASSVAWGCCASKCRTLLKSF